MVPPPVNESMSVTQIQETIVHMVTIRQLVVAPRKRPLLSPGLFGQQPQRPDGRFAFERVGFFQPRCQRC